MLELKFIVARLAQLFDISMPKDKIIKVVDQGSLRPEGKLIMNVKRRSQ